MGKKILGDVHEIEFFKDAAQRVDEQTAQMAYNKVMLARKDFLLAPIEKFEMRKRAELQEAYKKNPVKGAQEIAVTAGAKKHDMTIFDKGTVTVAGKTLSNKRVRQIAQ